MRNNTATFKDCTFSQNIFGKDVYYLKGKRTRTHPVMVKNKDVIEIKPDLMENNWKAELAMDVIYII